MSDASNDTTSQLSDAASRIGLGRPNFYAMSPSAEREMLARGIVLDAPYRVHPALPEGKYVGIYHGDPDEYIAELDVTMAMIALNETPS